MPATRREFLQIGALGALVPFLKKAEMVLAPRGESGLYLRFYHKRDVFGEPTEVVDPEAQVDMVSKKTRKADGLVLCYGSTPVLSAPFGSPTVIQKGVTYSVTPFRSQVLTRDQSNVPAQLGGLNRLV